MGRFTRKKKKVQSLLEADVINPAVWIEPGERVKFEGRLNLESVHRNSKGRWIHLWTLTTSIEDKYGHSWLLKVLMNKKLNDSYEDAKAKVSGIVRTKWQGNNGTMTIKYPKIERIEK